MPFENVEEVAQERTQEAANKRLAEGWTLLAVVPGFDQGCAFTSFVLGRVVSNAEKAARIIREKHATKPLQSIPNREDLHGALRNATQEELEALAELGVWMQRNHMLLATGRASGIRLGATKEVAEFMLRSLEDGGTVAGNLVILPTQ